MSEVLIVSAVTMLGVALWIAGASLYSPGALTRILEWLERRREQKFGPRATGLPIEAIAANLRRLLLEHDRLVRSHSDLHRAHHLRVCELALHDCAEEAAAALGLRPCCESISPCTRTDLGHRLHQLAAAGLVLPEIAGLGGRS